MLITDENSHFSGLSRKAFPHWGTEQTMHETFFEYLQEFNIYPITEEERAFIRKVLKPLRLRRRQYFLQAGNQCNNFAFIVKGAVKQYFINDNGSLHIACFGIDRWWIGDRESYVNYTPSIYHIEAVEETQMLLIGRSDFLNLLKFPGWRQMQQELDTRNIIAGQQRINGSISDTAEKRYRDFVASFPDLYERFSQQDIASYLGVNKDTLCRIKRQLCKCKGNQQY